MGCTCKGAQMLWHTVVVQQASLLCCHVRITSLWHSLILSFPQSGVTHSNPNQPKHRLWIIELHFSHFFFVLSLLSCSNSVHCTAALSSVSSTPCTLHHALTVQSILLSRSKTTNLVSCYTKVPVTQLGDLEADFLQGLGRFLFYFIYKESLT